MIFQRVNRTNAERVFIVMKANEAGVAADDVVSLDMTSGNADGINVVQPTGTTSLHACVGIADAAIADGAYGLVQVFGYRSTSRIFNSSSAVTGIHLVPIAESDALGPINATGDAASVVSPAFITLESLADASGSSTVSAKIFIRKM